MTKKTFLSIAMVFLGLLAGTNTAFAEMTTDEAKTQAYWAQLTAKPATATTGSGKVFVTTGYDDPTEGDYAMEMSVDGYSESFLMASLANTDVPFYVYAQPANGSYFAGWSYTDGNTDLGLSPNRTPIEVTPNSKKGISNKNRYTIYAAFEPIKITSYEISGSNTMTSGNSTCMQTVTFRAETPGVSGLGSMGDERHFKLPVITPKAGTTGTWSTSVTEWVPNTNITLYGQYALITVPVTFTAPNGDPGEYGAELVLETYAGVKMKVYLSARTTGGEDEAIRYNKSKVQQETGNLSTLLSNAAVGDIIKLNKAYASPVTLNKNITFDLNGYTLNTVTVSGGNVTFAYSPYGGSANELSVTEGKAILNGGSFGSLTIAEGAMVEQNGATITGTATNNGTLTTTDGKFQGGLTSSKTLVVNGGTFNGDVAINVTGGTAAIKRGTIDGTQYGIQTNNGGIATIEKLAVISGGTKALNNVSGTLTVNNGKFENPAKFANGEIVFKSAYFKENAANIVTTYGKQQWRNTAGPEAREGYAFFVGSQESAQASNVSVCRIGTTSYPSLEEALAYANNSGKQVLIIMENDYTLKEGYYTLPANATLVVPMSDDQEVAYPMVPREEGTLRAMNSFRKLILEDGVNLNVLGTIELTCLQASLNGRKTAIPSGNYGHLILKPGSHITLSSGSELRAWGYVTGDGTKDAEGNYLSGEIDARRGSIVREQFQMGDWKGGNYSLSLIAPEAPQNQAHVFPVYEYFIQNIESPVKYHPGSSLLCATSVYVEYGSAYANDIKVIGTTTNSMFFMNEMADAENTWVRKWYDVNKDQQVYEVNSGAKLGSMVIDLGDFMNYALKLNSAQFILPLTSNFKIHLLSGNMEFTQSTSCLPGMEVEVDKESTISIVKNEDTGVVSGALYFYDSDQWGTYAFDQYGTIVNYSATLNTKPTVRNVSSAEALGDAKLIVHGTFRVAEGCAVYTTVATASADMSGIPVVLEPNYNSGGASIFSTNEDAGTFVFEGDAPAFEGQLNFDMACVATNYSFPQRCISNISPDVLMHFDKDNGIEARSGLAIIGLGDTNAKLKTYGFQLCTSAQLQNGDGTHIKTYTDAEYHAKKGDAYCYINDRWTLMAEDEDDECFTVDKADPLNPVYYAKPADYVALANGKTPNADHTYSSADGTRTFILIKQNCQWWEVEKKDNLFHCIHPNNDTYYYWDDSRHKWVEKRFTITWQNWDGEEIKSYTYDELTGEPEEVEYSVTYGTMAEFLGSNPTREPNIDYTYDFTGWSPALGKVTSDVTYTATYNEQPRKYTVIFLNEGGTEIERQFLTHNEMPVCENAPTRTGYILQWEPGLGPVVGDQTYTATWLPEPPSTYVITFKNYDGTTLEVQNEAQAGEKPVYRGTTTPVKQATDEYYYTFTGWKPALVPATTNAIYVAQYSESPIEYTIDFYDEKQTKILKSESLPYGASPTPPVVSKEKPNADSTYTLVWKTLDEANTIQTVTGDASYKPTYLAELNRYTRYTVALSANIPAGVTLIGAGTYDKGESVTIQAIPAVGYEFVQWNNGETNPERVISSIAENITLTAEVCATAVAEDLEIPATGKITLTENTLKHDLVITSNGTTSGELIGAKYLTLTGDAYFDLNINAQAKTWYAVAVPWKVSVEDGIFAGETPLHLGSGFQMVYYNSEYRAANGKNDETYDSWIFMSNSDNMQPGKLYMMYVNAPATTIRFKKVATAPIQTTVLSVEAHTQTTGNDEDAGWNGIANPALFHAYINASSKTYNSANYGQKYIPLERRYDPVDMSSKNLIVGEPIFVQVATSNTISAYETKSGAGYAQAPRRAPRVDNASYEVQISAGEEYTDRIFLQTMEDKEDRYIIELDLAKAGISTSVAQMWVNRYNAKLCVNTTAPVGKTATYPLGISVPENGTYQISSATEMQNNQELYVTRNGNAIWNLAYGPYTVTLDKGTYSEYGIKLIQSNAPAVTTGVDQTTTDKLQIQKVLIDNKVYIVREGELYTITGQKVQ